MKQLNIIRTFILTAVIALLFSSATFAKDDLATAKIKTNPQCKDCKVKIEKALMSVEGVKDAKLDMKTKVVTVKYDQAKATKDNLSKAILDLGYKADEAAPANPHKCDMKEGASCSTKAKDGASCPHKAKAGAGCPEHKAKEMEKTENTETK